jgi:hypothetical protein
MIGLVRAHDLDRWGSRIVSPPELPRLVRRLVFATGRAVKTVDFPADEAIRLAGWDGKVLADEAAPYVPAGFSVWELGTSNDPRDKAEEDYQKRTKDSLGVDKSQTTFVFVTPRNWPAKGAWESLKRAEGKWKDVRVVDAEGLTQWLEGAPGVAVWLGPLIGAVPPDARALESECETYRSGTRPAFDLSGLLIGRNEQQTALIRLLQGPPVTIEISATTLAEGAAFIGASIETLPEDERESMFSRAVWVDSNTGMRQLAAADRPLIVVASGELPSSPIQHHRIVIKTSRAKGPSAIELGAQPITSLVEYLAGLGLDRNDAFKRSQEAAGYLERVRHTLLIVQPPPPVWALPPTCAAVAASVLMGSWDESNEADKAVVTAIAGVAYEEFVRGLTPYQAGPSPLMSHAGTVWKVYARGTAWGHLEPSLTSRQVQDFFEAAQNVLLEQDPRFELAADERWMAGAHDKRRVHSEHLRTGLASGLVHGAVLGQDSSACYAGWRAQTRVDAACRKIFRVRRDVNFWRRIRGELRELAEASPDEFLSALDADLADAQPQVRDLFEEEGAHGGCLHSDLLWALELLAWSQDYVGRAAITLAALDELDPGGHYSNRPKNSLAEILLPANPQCTLAAAERKMLFGSIMQRHPKAGWRLGKALMPTGMSVTSPTARPALRDWAPKQQKSVLLVDYWAEIQEIAECLVQAAGADIERWCYLLSNLKALQPALMERVLHGSEALARDLQGDERLQFWNRLRGLLHRHNQFREDERINWVYPSEILDRIAAIYESLTPTDLVARVGWLFSNQAARPTDVARDWKEEATRVDNDRKTAVAELEALDLPTLLARLRCFEAPYLLGVWLAHSAHVTSIERELLSRCANSVDPREQELAQGFAVARFEAAPQEFLRRWCMKDSADFLRPKGLAKIAQILAPCAEIWDLVEAAGPECHAAYWNETPVRIFDQPAEAERAARNLLAAGRALDTIDLLAANTNGKWLATKGSVDLFIQALEAAVVEGNAKPGGSQREAYNIVSLFKSLVDSMRLEPGKLMHLEWMYFGALQHQAEHELEIYKHLLSEPELLLQLVELIYLPEGVSKADRPAPSEAEQRVASQAWTILHEWQAFTSVSPQAMLTADDLAAIVERLRTLATARRFGRIVDDIIGKAFATSPLGLDGQWPHESIRALLERYGAIEEIAEGFVIGKCNLRGSTSRHPGDGGALERDLAKSFGEWQRALAVSHPQTSRLLGQLAEKYRSDANWEDAQVRTR